MSTRLTTEDGNPIISETVPGVAGASRLNDTRVESITKELFTIDPLTNGWLIGDDWEWDVVAGNMKMA